MSDQKVESEKGPMGPPSQSPGMSPQEIGDAFAGLMALQAMSMQAQPRDVYHNHKTTVHEHRAPTDKSVELLKEMESAATKKLIDCFKVEDNTLRAKWFVWENYAAWNIDVKCVFVINDKEYTIEEQIDLSAKNYNSEGRGRVIQEFIPKISKKVTERLFIEGKFPLNIFGR